MNEPITPTELLELQSDGTLIATVESVDEGDRVRITPCIAHGVRRHERSFVVSLESIESVTPIGTRANDNPLLRVVEVRFQEGGAVPIADFIEQVAAASGPAGGRCECSDRRESPPQPGSRLRARLQPPWWHQLPPWDRPEYQSFDFECFNTYYPIFSAACDAVPDPELCRRIARYQAILLCPGPPVAHL
jgi:hypothetical protein